MWLFQKIRAFVREVVACFQETFGGAIWEGYKAFYVGIKRKNCPYPNTDVIVDGTKSLTYRQLRERWLAGWDHGNCET